MFGGHCYYAEPEGTRAISLMVVSPGEEAPNDPRDGIVVRATAPFVDDVPVATDAGVRPGDARADVEAAYGAENLEESEHLYQPEGAYLDYHIADGAYGLRFVINGNDVVEAIHGGDGGAITFPEGCA